MSDYQHRWQEYIRLLERRAIGHPVGWVISTIVFGFLAGLNTVCALVGKCFLRPFSELLAIYAVATSYLITITLAFVLVSVLRRRQDQNNKIENT
jgi:predicted membrane protein